MGWDDKDAEEDDAEGSADAGRDDDRCPRFGGENIDAAAAAGVLIGIGTELRGTPHNVHILAAIGLSPGGFRLPHTSHSQLSNTFSVS